MRGENRGKQKRGAERKGEKGRREERRGREDRRDKRKNDGDVALTKARVRLGSEIWFRTRVYSDLLFYKMHEL